LDIRTQLAFAISIVLALVVEGSICVPMFVCSIANLDIAVPSVAPTVETPYCFARAVNLHRAIAVWRVCVHVIISVIFTFARAIAVIPKLKFSICLHLTGQCGDI
jgi:hypothetical protein